MCQADVELRWELDFRKGRGLAAWLRHLIDFSLFSIGVLLHLMLRNPIFSKNTNR